MRQVSSLRRNVETFNRLLVEDIRTRLKGSHHEYQDYYGDWPSDRFPAGNLSPVRRRSRDGDGHNIDRESDISDVPQYMRSSYTPSSMGIATYVKNRTPDSRVVVTGRFFVYDLVWPERQYLVGLFRDRYDTAVALDSRVTFPKRFSRLEISFSAEVNLTDLQEDEFVVIPRERLNIEISSQAGGSSLLRNERDMISDIRYSSLSTEDNYSSFKTSSNNGPPHEWIPELQIRIRRYHNHERLDVFLVNRTISPDRAWEWSFDPFFFDPKIQVRLENLSFAYVTTPGITEKDYRYSTEVAATGRNCHAEVLIQENSVISETLPIYDQLAINWPRSAADIGLGYHDLAFKDARANLEAIAQEMEMFCDEWETRATLHTGERVRSDDPIVWDQSMAAKQEFRDEIDRFRRGIKALENDEIFAAFRLMNMSFHERFVHTDPNNTGWRPFQLVFIVSVLPDILAREDDNFMDYSQKMPVSVLWLPTGAGKTEAFTAVVLLQAFFDRIRGKNSGVSAVLKFPLRFLSMQQLDRAVLAVVAANRVLTREFQLVNEFRKSRGIESTDYDGFSVGFFVGSGATPNDPTAAKDGLRSPIDMITDGAKEAENFRFIATCPHCRIEGVSSSEVSLRADRMRKRIIHVCSICGREIPIHITDTEIYSTLPTLVISTIDKWAAFGYKPEAHMMFGIVRQRCPVHGYGFTERVCCGQSVEVPGIYDGPPSIIVQDELHMLDESLGALSSQFETLMRYHASAVDKLEGLSSNGEWKIITSTATIAGYKRHVHSIYLKDSIVFPVKGPSSLDSCYFSYDRERCQRRVVGFIPHNMTHPNAVIKTLQYFHAFVKKFEETPGRIGREYPEEFGGMSATDESILFENVRTSLMYGIVKSETYQILHSIQDQIDPYLLSTGLTMPIRVTADVTGDTGPRQNMELLERLQADDVQSRPEFIVATSSISHGVDLAQLNFMVFRGQPRSTSEFIQALSRVGRSSQGVIFAVYNPNRERDATHYMLHNEFLDIGNVLIAPPSVDRFSRQSMERVAGSVILGSCQFGRGDKRLLRSDQFIDFVGIPANSTRLESTFLECYVPTSARVTIRNCDALLADVRNIFSRTIRTAVNWYAQDRNREWTSSLLKCLISLRQTDDEVQMIIDDGALIDEIRRLRGANGGG